MYPYLNILGISAEKPYYTPSKFTISGEYKHQYEFRTIKLYLNTIAVRFSSQAGTSLIASWFTGPGIVTEQVSGDHHLVSLDQVLTIQFLSYKALQSKNLTRLRRQVILYPRTPIRRKTGDA